jgi:prepilin-type N-terminal cleavage/methylation domain-containing protein
MKKAFSLMEVIIAVMILSVVMVTLLQVKSDNIFILSKSGEKSELRDYLALSANLNSSSNRNENLFLSRIYSFSNDELRRELKDVKIKIKDEEVNRKAYETDVANIEIITYETSYSIKDDIKKSIYTFKIRI